MSTEEPKRGSWVVWLLVSLLLVVAVALVLVGIVSIPALFGEHEHDKARWQAARSTMFEMQKVLNAYAIDHGNAYPRSLTAVAPMFGGTLPQDPFAKRDVDYVLTAGGFELRCLGKDQAPGGIEPPDADIVIDQYGSK